MSKGVSKKSFVFTHNSNLVLGAVHSSLLLRFTEFTIIRNDKVVVALEVGTATCKEMDLLVKGCLDTFKYLDDAKAEEQQAA